MLHERDKWIRAAEVNPPELPDLDHMRLTDTWRDVLVTDNVFGKIRVSPFAYAARITHDVPSVRPTVVVSTRDRNILAIESEVRGALGNGVDSFLVVIGDTLPQVDHLAHHYEIVDHLTDLQGTLPAFQVGMATRFKERQYRTRMELGAQFFVCGPVLDPSTVEQNVAELRRKPEDPPLFLMLIPPFSLNWVNRMESIGSVPVSDGLKRQLEATEDSRAFAWSQAVQIEQRAMDAGCGGVILMGLSFDTMVGEAFRQWAVASGS